MTNDHENLGCGTIHLGDERIASGGPIVVGVDGSGEAQRGLLFAASLAMSLKRRLVAVHALGMYDHLSGWTTSMDDYRAEADEAIVNEWCASLRRFDGLRWTARVIQGEPVHALLAVADDVDAGFVVLGSHGAGTSGDPLLGSTSHKVLLHSHRPVVVVPPGVDHPHHRSRFAGSGAGSGAMNSSVADH